MTVNFTRTHAILAGVLVAALIFGVWAVSGNDRDPEWLREKYGITNAFSQEVQTPEGTVDASLVPVTLADGRTASGGDRHRTAGSELRQGRCCG